MFIYVAVYMCIYVYIYILRIIVAGNLSTSVNKLLEFNQGCKRSHVNC